MPPPMIRSHRELLRQLAAAAEAEGRAEGRRAGITGSIFNVLEARGVEITNDARATITNCGDFGQLYRWIRRAATAESVEDLGGPLSR